MAEETKTPGQEAAQPEAGNSGGSKAGIIILVILLTAALGGAGYLFYQVTELQKQLAETSSSLEKTTEEKDSMESDLKVKIEEFEALRADYEERGLAIDDLDEQIALLKNEMDTYKARLNSANADKRALNRRINKVLAQAELEKQKLLEHIERLEFAKDSLGEEVEMLYEERGEYIVENATLEQKVAVASILKAEDIVVTALNAKGKEDDKLPFKAKKVSSLIIRSTLADNKVAEQSNKEFYLRIIEPSGNVLFSLETGGGSFEANDNKTKFYTQKKSLLFDNTNQPLNFTYEKGEEYVEGNYKVEIYCNGYKVGESEFEMK